MGSRVMPALRMAQVQWITIRSADKQMIHLVLEARGWQISKPLLFPGNSRAMEQLIDRWASLRSKRLYKALPRKHSLAAVMDKPCLEITFGGQGRKPLVGKVACKRHDGLVPVQVAGDEAVHLVDSKPEVLGLLTAEDLRSRRAFLARPELVTRLVAEEIKSKGAAGKTMVLEQRADGRWDLVGSWGRLPADGGAVARLLNGLTGLRWSRLLQAKPQIAEPSRESTAWRLNLREGEEIHQVYLTRTPCPSGSGGFTAVRLRPFRAEFCLPRDAVRILDHPSSDLLEKRVVDIEIGAIRSIGFLDGKKGFALKLKEGTWRVIDGKDEHLARSARVRAYLNRLYGLVAKSLRILPKEKVGDPEKGRYLELRTASGFVRRIHWLDSKGKKSILLGRDGEPLALEVDGSAADLFLQQPSRFRSLLILTLSPEKVMEIKIQTRELLVHVQRKGNALEMTTPVIGGVDSDASESFLGLFRRLRAKEMVGKVKALSRPDQLIEMTLRTEEATMPSDMGFVEYFWWAASSIAAQSSRLTMAVVFGAKGCSVRLGQQNYHLFPADCEKLRHPLVPRKLIWNLSAEDVTELSECKGKASCRTWNQKEGVWSAGGKEIKDQHSIREKLAVLMDLRAMRVIRYGNASGSGEPYGRICIRRPLRMLTSSIRETQGFKGQDHERFCLVVGTQTEVDGTKGYLAWIANRPVVYLLSAEVVPRLFTAVRP